MCDLSQLIFKNNSSKKVMFLRISPYPLNESISYIFRVISDKSWINKFDKSVIRKSYENRVNKTVEIIEKKLKTHNSDKITTSVGEYIVSILAKQAIVNNLNYLDIPVDELWKIQRSGNPGFDFHSESLDNLIIFGESKYVGNTNAYNDALKQICEFVNTKKDLDEIAELRDFVSDTSLANFEIDKKGYAAAFSATSIDTKDLISNILKNKRFKELIKYDELILVAVDIYE